MQVLINKEKNDEKLNCCPICGLNGGNGSLCENHAELTKDFKWLRNYINSLEKFDRKILYVLDFSIGDRVSVIINDIDIVNGKMLLDEYLLKPKCSEYMEKIIREILALQKAKSLIKEMVKEGQ